MTNLRRASRKFCVGTLYAPNAFAVVGGAQIKSALPLEPGRSESSAKRRTNLPRVGATQRRTVKSSRQFGGVLVSQNANRLLELIDLEGLL